MQDWLKVTSLLCAFGVLREIRPSEPFVSEFLLGEWRNITEVQLNRDVYPIGTYSYLSLLFVVFLITDYLRFKPVIILSGISGIVVYAILLWTTSLTWVQVTQFFYGLYMATEVAYLTYIYAKVDPDKYAKVSSYTRMAALTGRFLSGVSAQILTQFGLMNYRQLNYITFVAQILATFWAIWLPPVKYGVYFHRRNSVLITNIKAPADKHISNQIKVGCKNNFLEASSLIAQHSRSAYSRPKTVIWCLLYASALALFVQTQTYVQLLWKDMQNDVNNPVALNGAVEAVLTILGAGGAYLASVYGPTALIIPISAIQGIAVFASAYPRNIYISYCSYVIIGVLFHYTITLASAKIASQLNDDSCFGLIFGINTFVGTGLQSLMTFVLISDTALGLPISGQYYVISGLYMILAAMWFIGTIIDTCKKKKSIKVATSL